MPDPGRIAGAIIIPNAVQVRLIWNLANGKQVFNVLHGQVAAGFNATSAVAEAVRAAVAGSGQWTAWAAFLHTTVALAGVDLRDLRSANQPLAESTGGAVAGTGAGAALPPGVALVLTLRTNQSGRAFRGRVYLPGLDSGALTAGTGAFSAAAQTAAINFLTEVQGAMNANGMTLSIAQPARQQYTGKTGANHLGRAANIVNVTSIVSRINAAGSQRRRS